MTKVNSKRVVLGGLVAGVVQYVLEGVVNGALLGNDWKAWAEPLKPVVAFPTECFSMSMWGIQSLMLGLAGMSVYAAMRALCGPGPKTAAFTGVNLWLVSWGSCFLNNMALGVPTHHLLLANLLAGLPVAVLSMIAGASLYKD